MEAHRALETLRLLPKGGRQVAASLVEMAAAEFLYVDLQQQKRGAVVDGELDTAANVFLLDSSNFSNYTNGRRFRYYGGQARASHAKRLDLAADPDRQNTMPASFGSPNPCGQARERLPRAGDRIANTTLRRLLAHAGFPDRR